MDALAGDERLRAAWTHLPAIVEMAVGRRIRRAEHMQYGHATTTFEVDVGDRTVVVRVAPKASLFSGTARNLDVLSRLGVAVPRVLGMDLSCGTVPVAWMVLEHIPGRDLGFVLGDLTSREKRGVATRVAEAQRIVTEGIPAATTYGHAPIGEEPGRRRFSEVLGDILARVELTLPSRLVPRLDVARRRLDELQPYLNAVQPRCFLDDATVKNVIVDAGEFRGIVDLHVVCFGDVLLCVGLTQTGAFADVGEHALDYIEYLIEEMRIDGALREVIDVYSAVFVLEFLRDGERSPAGERQMVEAFDRWVGRIFRRSGTRARGVNR